MEGTNNDNIDFNSGQWSIMKDHTADKWLYQFLRFVLDFDERKIKMNIISWLYL